jgi:hypothetical protein
MAKLTFCFPDGRRVRVVRRSGETPNGAGAPMRRHGARHRTCRRVASWRNRRAYMPTHVVVGIIEQQARTKSVPATTKRPHIPRSTEFVTPLESPPEPQFQSPRSE